MKRQSGAKPSFMNRSTVWCLLVLHLCSVAYGNVCPAPEEILPCRCSTQEKEIHIWCSHSNLPQIMNSIKSIEKFIKTPIDELVLENNQLPALPGRFFGSLQIVRLMLRHNSLERVSNGWLNELENSLVEVFIVEPRMRSIPVESLNGFINLIALTIQSNELKYLPNFSGLLSLMYLNVQSKVLAEVQPNTFRHLPKLQEIHINGGPNLNRLQAGLFKDLVSVQSIDLARNGITWMHLRTFYRLPNLVNLKLSYNDISDVAMIGRLIKDLENLRNLRLDHNIATVLSENSFVDLPMLSELYLNDNRITEIKYGAFYRTPNLKRVFLHNNHIKRIHPESFLQMSGTGIESLYIYQNEMERVDELRSLLDSLPTLKFLDMSNNLLKSIPFGALRGHGTLEQLHINNNYIRNIGRDAFMAMPALRELRMKNNSLSEKLPRPFWNLPGLMGLDLSQNLFSVIDSTLLTGLPSLRRLDVSENLLNKIHSDAFQENPMLETLNISSNGLTWVHPDTFRNLNRLFEIDASNNRMTEFIPGLPNIVERISIRNNLISSLHPSVGKLPNLRMLDLSLNKIEQIPRRTFQMTNELRVLSLADNKLRRLESSTFLGGEQIELLNLQNNDLADINELTFSFMHNLRTLNLNGNKLELITDRMFANNSKLEQLNMALNNLRNITKRSFEQQGMLEFLDISGNRLSDMSISLANLKNLRDIDLSYNNIIQLEDSVLSAWKHVEEIRLSNNLVTEVRAGTFQNLPKLQYLDLSSNEIAIIEPGAVRNLRELQELVLADNKIAEMKQRVFENLPNLLAVHLQHNLLRFISPDSFWKCPSVVFFNLSNNNFYSMDNVGLHNMKNLEVLDLSFNAIRAVSTLPLRSLSWLVELKMDNNQICKIQGYPFEVMPRLRVLSLRNNHLRTLREKAFKNLRGNIAILDIDGNPMICSCSIQWLKAWLEETGFPEPGPACRDGQFLRSLRTDRLNCTDDERSSDVLPLYNEHGDLFAGEGRNDIRDECDSIIADIEHFNKPLPTETDFFYDQFVDYPTFNNSIHTATNTSSIHVNLNNVAPALNHNKANSLINGNIDLSKTLLNTSILNRHHLQPQQQSPFTFFGYPIPSFNVGGLLGGNTRRDRGYKKTKSNKGKVRMLQQPTSSELEKYLAQKTQFPGITSRSRISSESTSDEAMGVENTKFFKTSLTEPNILKGGFTPITPEQFGGFIPMTPSRQPSRQPIIYPKSFDESSRSTHDTITAPPPPTVDDEPTTIDPPASHTYYVTENNIITPSTKPEPPTTARTKTTTTTELYYSIEDSDETIPETTTSKTILLIPPEEELQRSTFKASLVTELPVLRSSERAAHNSLENITPRIIGGRPTITKVFTAQTLQQYLPAAQEFFSAGVTEPNKIHETEPPVTAPYRDLMTATKDGMDWYYKSYKNRNRLERHERLENSFRSGATKLHGACSGLMVIAISCLFFI